MDLPPSARVSVVSLRFVSGWEGRLVEGASLAGPPLPGLFRVHARDQGPGWWKNMASCCTHQFLVAKWQQYVCSKFLGNYLPGNWKSELRSRIQMNSEVESFTTRILPLWPNISLTTTSPPGSPSWLILFSSIWTSHLPCQWGAQHIWHPEGIIFKEYIYYIILI